MQARLLLGLALSLPSLRAAVIKDIWGANRSEVLFASGGGGTHVYLSGVDVGSAFAPPTVLIGARGQVACNVQPFTSAKNRMHCIISSENAPAPLTKYDPAGRFVSLPVTVLTHGRLAECWHKGKVGDSCAVRFDIGGTPRVLRVLTQTVESAGTLRLSGQGIDGGLHGAQRLAATLYRGAVPVLGACGEKDCQTSNMGAETLGCYSRPDAGGSGISGGAEEFQPATVFSDSTRFGCVLDKLGGGLTGGFFNVSLTAIADTHHRGDAYLGFLGTKLIDVATGESFDAEMPPRITSIQPQTGSLAGGTDLTVTGTGFGSDASALNIDVAGIPCDVMQILTSGVHCRLRSHPAATVPERPTPTAALGNGLGSFAGERGVRWQWHGANSTNSSVLLPSFALPVCGGVNSDLGASPTPDCCCSGGEPPAIAHGTLPHAHDGHPPACVHPSRLPPPRDSHPSRLPPLATPTPSRLPPLAPPPSLAPPRASPTPRAPNPRRSSGGWCVPLRLSL